MAFFFAFLISWTMAQDLEKESYGCDPSRVQVANARPQDEEMKLCLTEVVSKCSIVKAAQSESKCKWELPTLLPNGKEEEKADPRCQAYIKRYDGSKYLRKSTHDGSVRQAGVLNCENEKGAILTSHKNNKPLISYSCQICSTAQDSALLQSECTESIFAMEVEHCKKQKGKCRHMHGKTICFDSEGNQTRVYQ